MSTEDFSDSPRPTDRDDGQTPRGRRDLGGGGSGQAAVPKCFKCLGTNTKPVGKSAPYLAARLYLCSGCRKPLTRVQRFAWSPVSVYQDAKLVRTDPPRPEQQWSERETFECGCTLSRMDYDAHGLMKNSYPALDSCPACRGTGKVRDKHRHLRIKRQVGTTDGLGRGRKGYTAAEVEDSLLAYFPDEGWVPTNKEWKEPKGYRPGRPKSTTPNLEVTKLYVVDVVNELVDRNVWMLDLGEAEFRYALGILTMMVFALTPKANARDMASWLGIGKSSVYNYRKRGQMFLDMIADVQSLKHRADMDELRWAELFRRLETLAPESDDDGNEDEREAWTKP